MKMLCVQVLKSMVGNQIDYEKLYKLTSDAKFEMGDVKASIAALSFIFSNAAKYGCDDETLSNELQQLGLPKEHATSLCRSYSDSVEKLQAEFRRQSFRVSKLESVQWRVDYILSSSELKEVNEPSLQLKLQIKDPDTEKIRPVAFTLTANKFRVLLSELKQANSLMEDLKS
ncbi:hypothetical protein C0Q70_03179 [Pomacea canaliculata]|uniref:COMM domain-containing protein n=2 Tax=Pomacea canaliculata TaxID=400727 RepID=A0A2T7PS01_POMCA|nr:hypothetical protein C0Q70_03179 [Pomacea canaliculata]